MLITPIPMKCHSVAVLGPFHILNSLLLTVRNWFPLSKVYSFLCWKFECTKSGFRSTIASAKKKKKSYYVLDCFQRINREGVIVGIGFSLKLDEEWMFSKAKKKKNRTSQSEKNFFDEQSFEWVLHTGERKSEGCSVVSGSWWPNGL